jgi:hypothetical protein
MSVIREIEYNTFPKNIYSEGNAICISITWFQVSLIQSLSPGFP